MDVNRFKINLEEVNVAGTLKVGSDHDGLDCS